MRVLLVVFVLMSPIAGVAQVAPAVTEVEQVMKAFLVPFSNQVVADFIDYFADDAVVFFPSAQFAPMRVEGKANIARAFESVFKPGRPIPPGGRPVIQPQDLKIQILGETAIVTFHLGNDTTRGRRTFVLQRINSKWRIVHLHASTVAAP
jgi:ketosteroid isomerase-like protein